MKIIKASFVSLSCIAISVEMIPPGRFAIAFAGEIVTQLYMHGTPSREAIQDERSLEHDFISELITRHVVALQSGGTLADVIADDNNRSGLLFQETLGFEGVDVLEAMIRNQAYMASLSDASDSLIQFAVIVACSSHSRTVAAAQAVVIPDGPRAPRFLAPPQGHRFVVAPEMVEDEAVRAEYEVKYRAAQHAEQQWNKKSYLEGRVALSKSMGESTIQLIRRVHTDRADGLIAEALAQASLDADIDYFEVYKLNSLRDFLPPTPTERDE